MRIVSIDVGIKNLSYIFVHIKQIRPHPVWNIIKWNTINIVHNYSDLEYVYNNYQKWTKIMLLECIHSFGIVIENTNYTKSELHLCIKNYLKSKNVTRRNTYNLQKIVSNISHHFDSWFHPEICDVILIENQPCMKNPQMKSIQMIVFTYFCLRSNALYDVKCISASEKMKFCKAMNWIDTIPKKDYKKTKQLSIQIIEKLLGSETHECWKNCKKKDDLSDVFLQALAYCDKVV